MEILFPYDRSPMDRPSYVTPDPDPLLPQQEKVPLKMFVTS